MSIDAKTGLFKVVGLYLTTLYVYATDSVSHLVCSIPLLQIFAGQDLQWWVVVIGGMLSAIYSLVKLLNEFGFNGKKITMSIFNKPKQKKGKK